MSAKRLSCIALLCALIAQSSHAAPILTVTPNGLVSGNRQWSVTITPDASLFTNSGPSGTPPNTLGGSVATEVGFTVGPGSLVGVTKNATNFPFDNPGNSPFPAPINGVQFGVVQSANNLFAALGSTFFTSATQQQFLTVTTLGSGPTTLSWLGAYVGKGRIAEGGINFDLYSGSASILPEPASCVLAIAALTAVFAIGRRRGSA